MKLYSAGNCTAAVQALAHVRANSSDALAAQFYTGVCSMHMGMLDSADSTLRRVAAAGDSPQEEDAWYYLAQIALARSAAAPARQDLEKVIALHGDLERAAKKQLGQIPR
jgi:predicted Zn-dependent protease